MTEECYTDYHKIDELDLCKLIAHEVSDGTCSHAEVYGMLLLVLRLRDTNTERVAPVSASQEIKAGGHFTDYNQLPIGATAVEGNPAYPKNPLGGS